MKVIKAEFLGFCFGVERAIELAEKSAKNSSTSTLGRLIHNQDEINRLKDLGIDSFDNNQNISNLIIRSHGEKKDKIEEYRQLGYNLIDATCPYVTRIHKLIDKYSSENMDVIIIGDRNHQEVIAASTYSNSNCYIISNIDEIDLIPFESDREYFICSQTTLNEENYNLIKEEISKRNGKFLFVNTICKATSDRQNAVRKLAKEVDAVIIIGGKDSSNTKKLYEIAKNVNKNSFFCENAQNLEMKNFKKYVKIGIGAGASTPQWIINEVIEKLLQEKE